MAGTTTPNAADSFEIPGVTSPSQSVGAYDAWADQAFAGPSDAENQVFNGVYGIGSGQDANGRQANVLMGQAGERATAPQYVDPHSQMGETMGVASAQYQGTDPSSAAVNPQLGAYLSMVGPNGGYDAATKAAIANEGNAALNAQEASARDQMSNAQARTGSPLGAYGAIADVSQNIGNQRSAQARQNQILFANEQQRQKEAGASGLGTTAGIMLGRENAGIQNYMGAQQQAVGQTQAAANQANQFINDDTARRLAGLNAAAAQNAAQRQAQQAGASGLTNLLSGEMGAGNQLYTALGSILGTEQGDTSEANTLGGNAGFQLY